MSWGNSGLNSVSRRIDHEALSRAGAIAMAAFLLAASALAQGESDPYLTTNNIKGVQPFGSHQFDAIDSVNLSSGGLDVTIPIYRRAGRGLDTWMTLTYSSKIWKVERDVVDPGPDMLDYMQNSSAGFRVRRGFGSLSWRDKWHDCPSGNPSPSNQVEVLSNFVYTTADGATVRFPNRIVREVDPCVGLEPLQEPTGTSESRVMLLETPETGDYEIVLKDGTREILSSFNGFAIRRIDPNGNVLEPNRDTLGRTGFFDSSGNPLSQGVLFGTAIHVPQGSFPPAPPNCDAVVVTEHGGRGLPAVASLPNGLIYGFSWNADFNELERIDLPSGGYIRYEYATLADFDPFALSVGCSQHSRRVVLRAVGDGLTENVWTYSYSNPGPQSRVTTVTDPEGNVSKHYFDGTGFRELTVERFDDLGNLLERVENTWHSYFAPVSSTNTTSDNPFEYFEFDSRGRRILATEVERDGMVKRFETDWDEYIVPDLFGYTDTRMNRIEERAYDWGEGQPGALLRRTRFAWLHEGSVPHEDRHIWNRMSARTVVGEESVLNGQGVEVPVETVVARTEFAYDGHALENTNGTVVQHDYVGYPRTMNVRGNLTKRRDWLNTEDRWLETLNHFDDVGNLIKVVNPRGKQTLFSYLDSWSGANCASGQTRAFLTATTNHFGHVSTRTNLSCNSQTASVTDPNGRTTSFSYDAMDRLKSVAAPDGGQHVRFYSDLDAGAFHLGQPVFRDAGVLPLRSKTFTSIEAGLWKADLRVLDGLGRIRLTAMRNGAQFGFERWDFVETGYDASSRRSFVSNPQSLFSFSDYPAVFFPHKTETLYDGLDRVVTIVAQDGQPYAISYEGNERTATDQAGASRRVRLDGLGRIVQVREPDPATGSLDSGDYSDAFYDYDPLDNLTRVLHGPGSHEDGAGGTVQSRGFVHDSLSRLIEESHPESGTTRYSYDDQGNLKQRIDARGRVADHTYDDLDRMTSTSYQSGDPSRPETTPPVSYFWDGVISQNLRGRLRQVNDGAGSSVFQYDSMGRVSRSVRTTLGKTLTADYTWNHLGGIRTASYGETNPAGYALIWSYDEQGRQVAFQDSLGTPLVTSRRLIHDPSFGTFEEISYPNGIVERIEYNSRLQPDHREARRSSGQYLLNVDYDFYGFSSANNGNVRGVDDLVDSSRDRLFSYDALNRLTAVFGLPWSILYEYDRFGNRLVSDGTASAPNFADALLAIDPATNRVDAWAYDSAGNVLDDGAHHFAWDAIGRMTAMGPSTAGPSSPLDDGRSSRAGKRSPSSTGTRNGIRPRSFQPTATYLYDYAGRRAAKVTGAGGRVYFWDEAVGEVIWEFPTGPGAQDVVRGWFDGRLVVENDTRPGGGLHNFFRDHLGSTQVTADYFTGAPVCSSFFHPFGQSADPTACDVHARKFTSKERDPESGMDYFGARYYDSVSGRFASPDEPLLDQDPLNPQSWNLYSYVRNRPMSHIDPTGEKIYVGDLSEEDKAELLNRVNATYGCDTCVSVDADGYLQVDTSGLTKKVKDATSYLTGAINSTTFFANVEVSNNDSGLAFGSATPAGTTVPWKGNKTRASLIRLDFADDRWVGGDEAAKQAFLNTIFAHEVAHLFPRFRYDPQTTGQTGDVVDVVNNITDALGLPRRTAYLSSPLASHWIQLPFAKSIVDKKGRSKEKSVRITWLKKSVGGKGVN